MSGRRTVFVNARFLSEPITGVQRCGRELLREFDAMLEEGEVDRGRFGFTLLTPEPPLGFSCRHLQLHVAGPWRSHLWEQMALPRRAPGFLLSLKNTAPAFRRGGGLLIHDLQVYGCPDTHGRTFQRLYRFITPRAARRAAALFAPSQFTAGEIERFLAIPAAAVTVTSEGHEHALREGADPAILARHRIPAGAYLLAVSSLNPNKNFAAVLRALRLLDTRDVAFVIAGGANPQVFARSDPTALPAGAIHVGRVSDAELRALYENALAFVFPSFYEGFGLPPLEAMALGCPVVCSNSSSLPEVGGDAVLYCDPADDADIARQVRRLIDEPRLRGELAERGRRRAAGFRWRDAARRIWQRIEPLL
ncbi:MAG: glycosyltransferase family 1 protein [Planctomycetota bacterium]|nr:MAG: glycosyltransferase family 1 protein [Planctomycetota bacterium]